MEENTRKGGTQEASTNGPTGRKHRYTDEDDKTAGHRIKKCSGEYSSRSCAAGIIADCVAVCCCPCAVVNLLTLAFVKVPYMMGRKCLGRRKKKKKKEMVLEREREGIFWREKEMGVEIGEELGMEKEENNYGARFEAEKVWLELYQVGHLGFGRVSFTGIHSPL